MTTILKVINWDLKQLPDSETYYEVLDVNILTNALQFECPMQFEKFAIKNIEQNKLKWLRTIDNIEFKQYNFYELDFSQRTDLYVNHFENIDDISLNYPCGDKNKLIEATKYL